MVSARTPSRKIMSLRSIMRIHKGLVSKCRESTSQITDGFESPFTFATIFADRITSI